ncbi:DUF4190 domain-containing protein [Mycobacterium sp. Marseille-P9652]|uniref:DUF4190 domain-containing protein n=1 Tax=Mycobacterium sp. Marseille-P9652 TaxID=2654950 RepID=UPI001E48A899|nr:DUF4190 domain-containing protein [Mycobacterium sp. Marseille-P9652]
MSYPSGPGMPPPQPPQPPQGGYPPAPYQPPYPPPGYTQPPQNQTTSGFAIASLVLGILGGVLLSVIFGIIALGRTKPGGQRGRGMAIAGLVLSGVWVAVIAVAVVFAALSPNHTVSVQNIKAGDCFADTPSGDRVAWVNTTSCDRQHSAEVVAVLTMPDGSFPPDSVFDDYRQRCRDALSSYSSTAMQDPNVDLAVMPPSRDSWKHGDRDMVCIATFNEKRTGSIKG